MTLTLSNSLQTEQTPSGMKQAAAKQAESRSFTALRRQHRFSGSARAPPASGQVSSPVPGPGIPPVFTRGQHRFPHEGSSRPPHGPASPPWPPAKTCFSSYLSGPPKLLLITLPLLKTLAYPSILLSGQSSEVLPPPTGLLPSPAFRPVACSTSDLSSTFPPSRKTCLNTQTRQACS